MPSHRAPSAPPGRAVRTVEGLAAAVGDGAREAARETLARLAGVRGAVVHTTAGAALGAVSRRRRALVGGPLGTLVLAVEGGPGADLDLAERIARSAYEGLDLGLAAALAGAGRRHPGDHALVAAWTGDPHRLAVLARGRPLARGDHGDLTVVCSSADALPGWLASQGSLEPGEVVLLGPAPG